MKLIVGFGNPEAKYNFTRHNFGFLTLDFYAKIKGLSWEPHPKFDAIWLKSGDTIFIKPQTYYNEVGKAIQAFSHFFFFFFHYILFVFFVFIKWLPKIFW